MEEIKGCLWPQGSESSHNVVMKGRRRPIRQILNGGPPKAIGSKGTWKLVLRATLRWGWKGGLHYWFCIPINTCDVVILFIIHFINEECRPNWSYGNNPTEQWLCVINVVVWSNCTQKCGYLCHCLEWGLHRHPNGCHSDFPMLMYKWNKNCCVWDFPT